jgi:hypothetical protein
MGHKRAEMMADSMAEMMAESMVELTVVPTVVMTAGPWVGLTVAQTDVPRAARKAASLATRLVVSTVRLLAGHSVPTTVVPLEDWMVDSMVGRMGVPMAG